MWRLYHEVGVNNNIWSLWQLSGTSVIFQGGDNAGPAVTGAADAPQPWNYPHSASFCYCCCGKASA